MALSRTEASVNMGIAPDSISVECDGNKALLNSINVRNCNEISNITKRYCGIDYVRFECKYDNVILDGFCSNRNNYTLSFCGRNSYHPNIMLYCQNNQEKFPNLKLTNVNSLNIYSNYSKPLPFNINASDYDKIYFNNQPITKFLDVVNVVPNENIFSTLLWNGLNPLLYNIKSMITIFFIGITPKPLSWIWKFI